MSQFSSNDKKYTAGAWSPTRPSIIFLGTHEGNVEVWDLLEKTHEASVIQNISTGIVRDIFMKTLQAGETFEK